MTTPHPTSTKPTSSKRKNRALFGLCAGSLGVLGAIGIAAGFANAAQPQANASPSAVSEPADGPSGKRVANIDTLSDDMAEYDACADSILDGLDEGQLDELDSGNGGEEVAAQIDEACRDLLPIGVIVPPANFISDEENACINDKMGFTAEEIEGQQATVEYVEIPDDVVEDCVDLAGKELPADGDSWTEFDECLQAKTGIDVPALNSKAYEAGSLTDAEIESLNEAGMSCAEELLSPDEFEQYVEAEQYHDQLEADATDG